MRLGLLGRILQSLSMSQLDVLARRKKALQGDIDPAQRAAKERVQARDTLSSCQVSPRKPSCQ